MNLQQDSIISQITVRLKNKDNAVIGTGIIYYDDSLEDNVYILTASHCLFVDGDGFKEQRESINIDIYNTQTSTYNSITDKKIDSSLLFKDENKDVALLIFDKDEILKMIGLDDIPSVLAVQERHSFTNFATKGFSRATKGEELDTLKLQHPREMTEVKKLQFDTTSSHSDINMEGFSGSGVFLLADNEIYLYGIFTRYRNDPYEKGRVAYCQYIEPLNEILSTKFLPAISYTYIGENKLTRDFFESHIEKSVSNLGGRFNQKLNFRLPIGQVFNALSYNNIFKSRFLKIWDDWLTSRYQSYNLDKDVLKDIKEQLYSIRQNKIKWVSKIKFDYRQELEVKVYKNEIQGFNTAIRNKINELSGLEFCSDYDWKYKGVIEALSIILPEEYNLDIFEISECFIPDADKKEEWKTQHIYEWISGVELDSLKWRKVESINNEKITKWLQSDTHLSDHEWLLCLTELSSIIDHPFNSNRLTQILKKYSMAERDSFWQEFIIYFNGYDDDQIAFPIQRLIDWAWMSNISTLSDDETAKLVAQTLAWILSTTNTKLRDQTTKALVNLLEQKPNVLIGLLKTFQDVDDLYILERLYAVTYGCVLRTEEDRSVRLIAEYVYDTVFRNGNPPAHVLLRDYACNTIEYALYKKIDLSINDNLIRPPYNSKMNFTPLTNEELDKRYEPKEDRGHWGKAEWGVSAILRSMVTEYGRGTGGYGDFGRYTFQSAISNFDLPRQINVNLLSNLAVEWIFEKYGYSTKFHGKYDDYIATKGDRHESKIERIGKKYQWIAFYEIVGIIADNYKMKCYWEDEYVYFKGTWQLFLRDIDPATTTLSRIEEELDEVLDITTTNEWWRDKCFSNWSGEDSQWVLSLEDLVHPYKIIQKIDNNDTSWLHLHHYIRWIEPKKIGAEEYGGKKKQVWYILNAYLVKKADKQSIINYLQKKNFWGKWMPEASESFSRLINREKFWSPAYKDESRESEQKLWNNIGKSNYKTIVADTQANGNIEDDKSGTSALYKIPCKFIFEGMELQYASKDGDLKNKEGEIVVTNINPNGVMIREKELLEFLEKNDLDIIWTLLGEKFSFSNGRFDESYFKTICGVFYLEEGKMKGEMRMYDRE